MSVVTLQVISSCGPEIGNEDVTSCTIRLSDAHDPRILSLDSILSLNFRIQLNSSVSPRSERMLSDLKVSAGTLSAEAAGVTVEHIVVSVPLEHSGSLLLVGRDRG